MTQEKTVAEKLDTAERKLAALDIAEDRAKHLWMLEEAQARLRIKASEECKTDRWSAKDVDARLLVEQSDAEASLGQAWMGFTKARSEAAMARVEKNVLGRAHWNEIREAR